MFENVFKGKVILRVFVFLILWSKTEILLVINFELSVDSVQALQNNVFAWSLEISWRLIIPFDQSFYRFRMQIGPLVKLHEIQGNEVIEIFFEYICIAQIDAVVQFGETECYFHDFGSVTITQTFVWFSSKNSFHTFINHLGAYKIHAVIKLRLEVRMLFRKDQYRFICLYLLWCVSSINSLLYITPAIKWIISIKVDNLLEQIPTLVLIFTFALAHVCQLV